MALAAAVAGSGCQSVRLGQPRALWGLWLVPLWLWWSAAQRRRRARDLARLVGPACQPRVVEGPSPAAARLAAALQALAVLAMVLAAAQPRWGMAWEEIHRQGVDVVVALDVSESMRVQDVESSGRLSRLARAKREVTDLLRLMDGDRIGLVAFAGNAQVMCPLTLDHGAAQLFLDDIDTDSVAVKGTALADAIDVALQALGGEGPPGRSIILITDGESHVGSPLQSAAAAAAAGVRIFTIGIGRAEGAPIPADDGGFHRDREGNLVMSRLDAEVLRQIAAATGGRYVRSQTGEIDLEAIYRHGVLRGAPLQDFAGRRQERWTERFQLFLAAALALWLAESWVAQRMGRPHARLPAGGVAVGVAGLLASGLLAAAPAAAAGPAARPPGGPPGGAPEQAHPAAGGHAHRDPADAYSRGEWQEALEGFAQLQASDPDNPALSLAIGSTAYQLGDYPRARAALARAAQAPAGPIRTKALYALGNTAYREHHYKDAMAFYGQALAEDPEHHGARHNTELSRIALERAQEAEHRGQPGDPNDRPHDGEKAQQRPGEQAGADGADDGREDEPAPTPDGASSEDHAEHEKHGSPPPAEQESAADANRAAARPPDAGGHAADDHGGAAPQEAGGEPEAAHPGGAARPGLSPEEAMRALEQVDERRPHPSRPRGAPRVRGGKDW